MSKSNSILSLMFVTITWFNKNDVVFGGPVPNFALVLNVEPYCPSEVVVQAAENKFLEFVLLNCVSGSGFITEVLGPSQCLTSFNRDNNPGPNPIPISGNNTRCLSLYQNVVKTIAAVPGIFSVNRCEYTGGKLRINFGCALSIQSAIRGFIQFTGMSITNGHCVAAKVNMMTNSGQYANLVSQGVTKSIEVIIPTMPDDEFGLCEACYYSFYAAIRTVSNFVDTTPTPLYGHFQQACMDDPNGLLCKDSTVVGTALTFFRQCAGYDMFYNEQVCTDSDLQLAYTMINPVPYYSIVYCTYNSAEEFCVENDLSDYIDYIQTVVSTPTDCAVCFKVFQQALSTSDDAKAACGGGVDANIWTDECIALNANAFFAFEQCSGNKFDIQKGLIHPPMVAVEVASTTEAPATTTTAAAPVAETTTTVAPVTTAAPETTKSSNVLVGGLINAVVLIVLLSGAL